MAQAQSGDSDEIEYEFMNLTVERLPEDDADNYELHGLREDGTREVVRAGALNINGFAMATKMLDIGEYNETIRVVKSFPGSRYVNIIIQPKEE